MFVEPKPVHKFTMQSLLLLQRGHSRQSRLLQTATALSSPVDGKLNDLMQVSFGLIKYQQFKAGREGVRGQDISEDQSSDEELADIDEAQLELIRIFSNASIAPNSPITGNYRATNDEPIDRAHNPLPVALESSENSLKLVRRFSI